MLIKGIKLHWISKTYIILDK